MKFGVRDICNVVFKAKTNRKIGNLNFVAGQPVIYIDTAKTSSLEQSTTSVYATGGRGNARLVAWEGQKTMTFTVEDALISPLGFAVLSGAGLFDKDSYTTYVHVHMTTAQVVSSDGTIDLTDAIGAKDKICATAPIFVMAADTDGSLTGKMYNGFTVDADGKKLTGGPANTHDKNVFVDYYITRPEAKVKEIDIAASDFGGSYYVEADTLFRDQETGKDWPANLTFPNVKIQSNFTFNMSATGDPSTFTFTMDAFPGYTMFDQTKKVICVMQVIDQEAADVAEGLPVMPHKTGFDIDESKEDSVNGSNESGNRGEDTALNGNWTA